MNLNDIIQKYEDHIIFGSEICNTKWEYDDYLIKFYTLKLLINKHLQESKLVQNKKDKYKIIHNGKFRYFCPLCNKIVRHLYITYFNEPLSLTIKNIMIENENLDTNELFKLLLKAEKESLIIYTCKDCNLE